MARVGAAAATSVKMWVDMRLPVILLSALQFAAGTCIPCCNEPPPGELCCCPPPGCAIPPGCPPPPPPAPSLDNAALAVRSADDVVSPVLALLKRVLPAGTSVPFDFEISSAHSGCYTIDDKAGGRISITAGDVSLLTAGAGHYLRDRANLTFGWPRGGGSHVVAPQTWPAMAASGGPVTRCRRAKHSYFMNVCTHSYSLVWYGWAEWEGLLDLMALTGINLFLAMTGQEEVQYRTFHALGLGDAEIRGWFNGPAFLTWSRGQNEYGAGIAGPLPRSFMLQQFELQKQILARARQLGIVGQLPGFQGNVPIGLKRLLADQNITTSADGHTGWMDALDPKYAEVADAWMAQLTAAFGTDHWYQLDGYFNGGTAPWYDADADADAAPRRVVEEKRLPTPDPLWARRGAAAYGGLSRNDPQAVWSFQGFAFIGWSGAKKAAALSGFISAAPKGKLVIVDMDVSRSGAQTRPCRRARHLLHSRVRAPVSGQYGPGEWETKFDEDGFWGTPFIWTKAPRSQHAPRRELAAARRAPHRRWLHGRSSTTLAAPTASRVT